MRHLGSSLAIREMGLFRYVRPVRRICIIFTTIRLKAVLKSERIGMAVQEEDTHDRYSDSPWQGHKARGPTKDRQASSPSQPVTLTRAQE